MAKSGISFPADASVMLASTFVFRKFRVRHLRSDSSLPDETIEPLLVVCGSRATHIHIRWAHRFVGFLRRFAFCFEHMRFGVSLSVFLFTSVIIAACASLAILVLSVRIYVICPLFIKFLRYTHRARWRVSQTGACSLLERGGCERRARGAFLSAFFTSNTFQEPFSPAATIRSVSFLSRGSFVQVRVNAKEPFLHRQK